MKYLFLGSLIPILFLCIHSIKTFDIYFILYCIVYGIHLTGRPYYFSVEKWYQIHRIVELGLFTPYKNIIAVLPLLGNQVLKSSLYGLFVFMSGQNILSFILLFIICLHEIPIHHKKVKEYFLIRMAKNIVIFMMMFNQTNLLWSGLIIILFTMVLYYLILPKDKVDTEYFLNSIPITYPIPLDINVAVKHCKIAKILFK